MNKNIELLSHHLNLTAYQSAVLRDNYAQYNIARLEKRGGVLYAPYRAQRKNIFEMARLLLHGAVADVIGADKMLVRGRRGVRFLAGGMHTVKIGRLKYYSDSTGRIISRQEFYDVLHGLRH